MATKATVVAQACCYNPDDDESHQDNEDGDSDGDGPDKPDGPGPKPYPRDEPKGYKQGTVAYPPQQQGPHGDFGGYASQQSNPAAGAVAPGAAATPVAAVQQPAVQQVPNFAQQGVTYRAPQMIG